MHKSYKAVRLSAAVLAVVVFSIANAIAAPRSKMAQTKKAQTDVATDLAVRTERSDVAYLVQPGDVLVISVWKEPDLQGEVLVRPDGGLSFPLAGEVSAAGQSIAMLQTKLTENLKKYIPDPVVTISIKLIGGNRIYVVGKVNRPGEFALSRPLDVMQALSLAGGATPFAALNDIRVLRRDGERQVAIDFRYGDVEQGRKLEQNILLKSGDTVVVP